MKGKELFINQRQTTVCQYLRVHGRCVVEVGVLSGLNPRHLHAVVRVQYIRVLLLKPLYTGPNLPVDWVFRHLNWTSKQMSATADIQIMANALLLQ